MSAERDLGDENDGDRTPWRFAVGRTVVYYPRSWREEKVRAMPQHDPGDEDPWQPLCELSRARLMRKLGL